jgi:hypothetical protein
MKEDPEMIHIPESNKAPVASANVLTSLFVEKVIFTARINIAAISMKWKIIPLLGGSPRLFTKNRSSFDEIVTTPGIIPYISKASRRTDIPREIRNPFHEKSYFLK